MEFKRFIEQFVCLPAKIIRGGRQLTVRLLSWTESLDAFNRWLSVALEWQSVQRSRDTLVSVPPTVPNRPLGTTQNHD